MHRFAINSLFGLAMLAGCGAAPGGENNETTGSIDLALNAAGVTLHVISYEITGAEYSTAGSLDVTNSTRISAVIGGIPAGDYRITLEAESEGTPQLTCSGSASFIVAARRTTSAHVDLLCRPLVTNGSVMVGGTVRICPAIAGLSAVPLETRVGGSMQLSGFTAYTTDAGGPPLSWHVSGGDLFYENSIEPTLVCTAPGPVTVTFTLDPGQPCEVSESLVVTCSASSTPPSEDDPTTVGDDRAGYVACGSESCASGSGCCIDGPACGANNQECASPYAFKTCDGPEDCPAGTQCAIAPHAIYCGIPSPSYGVVCHTDADCDQNQYSNPCTDGACYVPFQ